MNRGYVTMLCSGDGYLPGVEVLGKSLEASGSTEQRIVLTTPDISRRARERLETLGWDVREVEPISHPSVDRLLFPRFANVFTKLRAWELLDLDRVVFLDADTLVLKNIDELFERRGFAAAPDFFLPDHFNSGVMVLEPSTRTFKRMLEVLAASGTYDGGDQGFLNTFYPDWYSMPVEHRLPVAYNIAPFIYQFMRGHLILKEGLEGKIKVLHYMLQKPWQAKATLTGGSEAWWHMYFELYPEKRERWGNRVHSFEDWTFEQVISFVVG